MMKNRTLLVLAIGSLIATGGVRVVAGAESTPVGATGVNLDAGGSPEGKAAGVASALQRLTAEGVKHDPPLRIRLSPGQVLAPDRQEAAILVTPLADAGRLQVRVTADDGLMIADGAPEIEIPVDASRTPARVELILSAVPSGQRRLLVRATLTLPDGTEQSAVALWAAERRERPVTANHPGSRIVRGPDGREVLEIPSGRR